MKTFSIRPAVAADAAKLNRARACVGAGRVLHALLAESEDAAIVGAAAYPQLYSAVNGAVGIGGSDLWVAEGARGSALGARLVLAVGLAGLTAWDAGFVRPGV